MSLDIGFAAQAPSLPGSGGGLGGLGETFSPDLSTGTGILSVPLDLPNGPNDIGPKLFLRYDSSAANGVFGLGWALPLPRLLRTTTGGRPAYSDDDVLVLEGSGPLVRFSDGTLRPEVETGEWRVGTSGDGFLATDRAGTRYELGTTPDSRIPGIGDAMWSWLLARIVDNLGNAVEFTWRAAGSQRYLERVAYGPFEVLFHYGPRPDPLRFGRGGFLLVTDERCTSIELRIPADAEPLVRRWDLGYARAEPNGMSLLASVTLTGRAADGTELTAPGLTFDYSSPRDPTLQRMGVADAGAMPPALGGANGRGRVELVDWNGDGLPDVIEFGTSGLARVWPNDAGTWARPISAGLVPQLAGPSARAGLVDLDGDGVADVVRVDRPLEGYQPRTPTGFGRPVTWRRAPAVALGDASCRLADLDGDGVPDMAWSAGDAILLAHRDGDGWEALPTVVPASPGGPPTDLADPHVHCVDMTGDGTPDLVRVDGRGVTYWPYLGAGVFGEPVAMQSPPILPYDTDPTRVLLVDLDGDGCADVVHLAPGRVRWWPNRAGSAFEAPRDIPHVPTGAIVDMRVADVLGVGTPAMCWTAVMPSGRGRWFALDPLGGTRCGLLTAIDNGIGRRTSIGYSTSSREAARDRASGRPWTTRLPIVLPVVGEVTVTDEVTGTSTTVRYRYHDGRFDGVLHEMCGFGEVEAIDVGDSDVATLVTTRWFHTGTVDGGGEPSTVAERRRARAIRGRIRRVERRAEDGMLFDRADSEWEVVDGDSTVTPRMVRMTQSVFEGADDPVSWVVTEQLAWDADGNVTDSRELIFDGLSPMPSGELRTRVEYAADPAGRFRQRAWRLRQEDGAGATLAETHTAYDGLPEGQVGAEGLVTARAALALTDGLVADVYGPWHPDFAALGYTRRPGTDGWWVDQGTYDRTVDATGIHGSITGPRGGVAELDLDPTGCYPIRARDAIGHELTAVFDLRWYQPTSITDPSGATSTADFDALARLVAVVEPGDSDADPTVAYSYDTSTIPVEVTVTRRTGDASPRLEQRDALDGEGRLLERRHVGDAGATVEAANIYGPRGLLVRTYLPRPATGTAYAPPPPGTRSLSLAYDALGRVVRAVRPDGAVATVDYLPGVIEEADEEDTRTDVGATHAGTVTRRVVDAFGRVVRTEERLGSRTVVTSDRFDLKGAAVEHIDAAGATTRFDYDLLGRVLRVRRPEASQIVVLDPSGNVVEARTGSSTLLRSFDLADRPTAVRHDSAAAAPVVTYTYHDPGPPPADAGAGTAGGRLVRVDDEAGTTIFDYDERGRIASKTMRPNGAPETELAMTYRSDGLVDSITYPGGMTIDYSYDRRGRLVGVGGVIDEIDYDDAGRPTRTRYANGVEQIDTHDPLTGWRRSATLTGPTGALRAVGYRYDRVGNLVEITSPEPALQWTYRHDDLYRLVDAGGAAGTWSYTYDDAGNLLSSSDLGVYDYGGGGAPATCVTGVGDDTFGFDDRGHVTSTPWGDHQIDAEGRLRRIDLTAGGHEELTYAHHGGLARRRRFDAAGAMTEAISPDGLIRFEDGVLVLQFTDGNRIVAREQAGDRTWLHTDHLGSVVLATDATGASVLEIAYGPYGQVLGRSGVEVPQGYAAGEAMVAGLVLLGSRWYLPQIGRFLSPDSVVGDASDPLAWNAYAYARCNPTSYIDPSGRASIESIAAAVFATIAIVLLIIAVSVATFGYGAGAAVTVGGVGIGVTWGAVFSATMIGAAAGGLIGGIAAARAGGDAGDIVIGVLVGNAVGGWAAFAAAIAGPAAAGGMGLTAGTAGAGVVAGTVSGAINGAAMGFASGFAGGKHGGPGDVMEKVLVGTLIGAAIGAGLGVFSALPVPKSFDEAMANAGKYENPVAPPAGAPAMTTPSQAPINNFGGAAEVVVPGVAVKYVGAAVKYGLGVALTHGRTITQTVLVDLGAAIVSEFRPEFGPFEFGGSW
jgi:RHS repeat-associated protein